MTSEELVVSVVPGRGRIEYRQDAVAGRRPVVLVLHGGHMSASVSLGEEVFRRLGYSLIVPSRLG